jgi:hypothetical protein
MKFTLRATFDAASVELNGDSYLLIKRSDFATLFDSLAVEELAVAPSRQMQKPRQQPPEAANNGHQETHLAVGLTRANEPGEPPTSQTFADCVRLALRTMGPASIGDILNDLTDSEIKTDRGKIAVCLSQLKKQGEAEKLADGRWSGIST